MRRSQLRRSKPMRRRTRIGGKPSQTKHARRQRDRARMAWTSKQRCVCSERWQPDLEHMLPEDEPAPVYAFGRCSGRIEVHHAGDRFKNGDGTRAFDSTVIPMCHGHHHAITNHRKGFADWPKWLVRAWQDAWIARCRVFYAGHVASLAAPPLF